MSKLVPHPQLLELFGFITANWLPIKPVVNSTRLPFKSSKLGTSITTFALESVSSKTTSSSSSNATSCFSGDGLATADFEFGSLAETLSAGGFSMGIESDDEERGGIVDSERRYWKPWHPPDSTWIRRARLGLESFAIISFNLCKS